MKAVSSVENSVCLMAATMVDKTVVDLVQSKVVKMVAPKAVAMVELMADLVVGSTDVTKAGN